MTDNSSLLEYFRKTYQEKYSTPFIVSRTVAINQARFVLKHMTLRDAKELVDWCFNNKEALARVLRFAEPLTFSIFASSAFLIRLVNMKQEGLPSEKKARFTDEKLPDAGW